MHDVDLWWARPRDAAPRLTALLDDDERTRLARFVRDADRDLFLVAHALARLAVATALGATPDDVRFDRTCARCGAGHGKPQVVSAVDAVQFSISHSGGRVAVAVTAAHPVGVDVEEVEGRSDPEELAMVILSTDEQRWLAGQPAARRRRDLLRYWTRKEAVVKATGDGISVGPATLTLTPPDAEPRLLSWSGRPRPAPPIRLVDADPDEEHVGCVAVVSAEPVRVVRRDGSALLTS